VSAFSSWALDIQASFDFRFLGFGYMVSTFGWVLDIWVSFHFRFLVGFSFELLLNRFLFHTLSDRPNLNQLSFNIRQFEIWTKWTILISVYQYQRIQSAAACIWQQMLKISNIAAYFKKFNHIKKQLVEILLVQIGEFYLQLVSNNTSYNLQVNTSFNW
ncbi:hypothetical protein RhiirB3_456701, partial [Rhizophagus irregularis]